MNWQNSAKQMALLAALLLVIFPARVGADKQRLDELEGVISKRGADSVRQGLFRVYAVEAIIAAEHERALSTLATFFQKYLGSQSKPKSLNRPQQEMLTKVSDAFLLLRHHHQKMSNVPVRDDVLRWLFDDDSRLSLFIDTVTLEDDWPQVHKLITQMYDHDPQGRDHFFRLILALAVVWDQPRPQVHRQMGSRTLPYEVKITERYAYFTQLFRSRDRKIDYSDLSVAALTFVVDTPVPIAELQWVRDNVNESLRNWGDLFFSIEYRNERVVQQKFQWPHGVYTLAAIKEMGGICVDQAYYAVIAARAYGIPALFFVGSGRRGPHAWLGYYNDRRGWTLDAGRYAHDKYATGYALNPQLNQPMTDHHLQYICDSALQSNRYAQATHYGRLAVVLLELGYLEAASACAGMSARLVDIYDLPWRVQEAVLRQQNNQEKLLQMLDEKARAFRKYPDFVAAIRHKQADILRESGQEKSAQDLLRRTESRLGRDRDDLARLLSLEQVQQAYERGDPDKARQHYEQILRNQRQEGQKIMALIEGYIAFTKETEQTQEAARFLRRYLDSLRRLYRGNKQNEVVLLNLLKRAYENANDERSAERVQRQIERLR